MTETILNLADLLNRPTLVRNLQSLADGGQNQARKWLLEAPPRHQVREGVGQPGPLVVAGQSQSSRHDPRREAKAWLARQRQEGRLGDSGPVVLFGLGSPAVLAELLADRPGQPVVVFEPDPLVALASLSQADFSSSLAAPIGEGLVILTPWDLTDYRFRGAGLLVHPPAQRRAPAWLARLRRYLTGDGVDLSHLSGQALRLMVIPPLSGGSWPVAVSLARAAAADQHHLLFLEWGAELAALEAAAQAASLSEAGRLTASLFEQTAVRAAAEATAFQPDLIVSLAQAPLDATSLIRLAQTGPAPLVFWLVEDFRLFGYVAEVAPAYDVLFHIQAGLIEPSLKNWGIHRAHYLPLAADVDIFQPRTPDETASYQADLSFMGAGYPNRRRLMTSLATTYWPRTGRPTEAFKIFGSGWSGVGSRVERHFFEAGRRVTLPECALIYAGGRVNLNIHSSSVVTPEFDPESRFVNPRTFEIAAAGGFQIVDSRPLLPPLFTAGEELVVATDPGELPGLIDYYLAHPDEAGQMGLAGRNRVLAEHTYQHRLGQMLADLGWSRA